MQEVEPYDILVIGGGINGCGIARDAAGRGFKVLLAEQADLASGTSSASTKLIHGGLRYLEQYEFRLVREALREREVLWRNAPHIIWPLRFVLPHHDGLRPAWLLRLGLFIYDHLGGRRHLPATRTLDLRRHSAGGPLREEYARGFEYSDCWVDDARLVVLNACDAADKGAEILTRTVVTHARRDNGAWLVTLVQKEGKTREVRARLLVNTAGPWVDGVLGRMLGSNDTRHVRMVQGSHIVVERKFEGEQAYLFQNSDGRIIFAIPYEDDFTLIGTTDRDFQGDPSAAAITQPEIEYLCRAASEYFREPVRPSEIRWTYAGVRALFDDGTGKAQEATRDYLIELDEDGDAAPLVNIYGGKITTYRRLAEAALSRIEARIGRRGPAWTANAPLPGGEQGIDGQARLVGDLRKSYPGLAREYLKRLARTYGSRAGVILASVRTTADLGRHFGADLYEAELVYLVHREFAKTADDILWRRTKLGLRVPKSAHAQIGQAVEAAVRAHGEREQAK